MKTPSFRVTPLPSAIAQHVRDSLTDLFGGQAQARCDDEPHQCRSCLTLTKPGEEVLLFSHSPFESRTTPYAERGPIFIHKRPCSAPASDTGYPSEFPHHDVVLRGYDASGDIAAAELVGQRQVEDVIRALLADRNVDFVHARNSTYGCFMFRIDRAQDPPG